MQTLPVDAVEFKYLPSNCVFVINDRAYTKPEKMTFEGGAYCLPISKGYEAFIDPYTKVYPAPFSWLPLSDFYKGYVITYLRIEGKQVSLCVVTFKGRELDRFWTVRDRGDVARLFVDTIANQIIDNPEGHLEREMVIAFTKGARDYLWVQPFNSKDNVAGSVYNEYYTIGYEAATVNYPLVAKTTKDGLARLARAKKNPLYAGVPSIRLTP